MREKATGVRKVYEMGLNMPFAVSFFCMFALFLSATSFGGEKIRVTAERVNLRSGAGIGSDVVRIGSKGDLLFAVKGVSDGDWVQVRPPENLDLWVYGELVRDGRVAVPRLAARSGAGIDHAVVYRFKKGDRVSIKEESGDWLRIEPPADCVLWISRKHVEPVSAHEPKPEAVKKKGKKPDNEPPEKPRPIRPSKPVKPVKPVPSFSQTERRKTVVEPAVRKPPRPEGAGFADADTDVSGGALWGTGRGSVHSRPGMPAGKKKVSGLFAAETLDDSEPQGREVSYTGEVRPSAGWVFNRPGDYRLGVRDSKGRPVTRCYILGNRSQLASLLGRNCRIEGSEYWLEGVRLPVVVPERIVLVSKTNVIAR